MYIYKISVALKKIATCLLVLPLSILLSKTAPSYFHNSCRLTRVKSLDLATTVGMLRDMENLGLLQEVEVGRWMRLQRDAQSGHGKVHVLQRCGQFPLSRVTYKPAHDKTYKMACASSEDSDQPERPLSLIRVFAVRMKQAWVLS